MSVEARGTCADPWEENHSLCALEHGVVDSPIVGVHLVCVGICVPGVNVVQAVEELVPIEVEERAQH